MPPAARPIPDNELRAIARLIGAQRWGALATINDDGAPLASMVAYVPLQGFERLFLHLSNLSQHTRNLLARSAASLVISEPDVGGRDPQTLARISLHGAVEILQRDSDAYSSARELYLQRLPDAEQLFDFSDFVLFCFSCRSAHYVGGFARAYALDLDELRRAAQI